MFSVTNIRSDDRETIAQVQAFLSRNADPGVKPRTDEAVERAIQSGQGLVVRRGVEAVGTSLIYKYVTADGTRVFSEIGTMRIIANGHGLQAFIAQLHLLQISIEADEGPAAVFAVVARGSASEHVLRTKVAMEAWQAPVDLERLRSEAGTPFSADKPILRANGPALARAGGELRALHRQRNTFATPKGTATVSVKMEWFDPNLLGLELAWGA